MLWFKRIKHQYSLRDFTLGLIVCVGAILLGICLGSFFPYHADVDDTVPSNLKGYYVSEFHSQGTEYHQVLEITHDTVSVINCANQTHNNFSLDVNPLDDKWLKMNYQFTCQKYHYQHQMYQLNGTYQKTKSKLMNQYLLHFHTLALAPLSEIKDGKHTVYSLVVIPNLPSETRTKGQQMKSIKYVKIDKGEAHQLLANNDNSGLINDD